MRIHCVFHANMIRMTNIWAVFGEGQDYGYKTIKNW